MKALEDFGIFKRGLFYEQLITEDHRKNVVKECRHQESIWHQVVSPPTICASKFVWWREGTTYYSETASKLLFSPYNPLLAHSLGVWRPLCCWFDNAFLIPDLIVINVCIRPLPPRGQKMAGGRHSYVKDHMAKRWLVVDVATALLLLVFVSCVLDYLLASYWCHRPYRYISDYIDPF